MSANNPPDSPDSADAELKASLVALRNEHRELDAEIARIDAAPTDDELLIRRLKKRKLFLKDQIASIENRLDPDEYA